nr:hypothetical protein Iba_chr12aCG13220 [Ipomoea batatas]
MKQKKSWKSYLRRGVSLRRSGGDGSGGMSTAEQLRSTEQGSAGVCVLRSERRAEPNSGGGRGRAAAMGAAAMVTADATAFCGAGVG